MSGITPAYAGNTQPRTQQSQLTQDHPRLRGEHGWFACQIFYSLGSPPPTRGTPTQDNFIVDGMGITPAYAGNT